MKVTLIRRLDWSPDGIQVASYEAGEHDLPDRALEIAERMGILKGKEVKAHQAAPDNKEKTSGRRQS